MPRYHWIICSAVSVALLGCQSEPQKAAAAVSQAAPAPAAADAGPVAGAQAACLVSRDTLLLFSDVLKDPETQDLSGFEIALATARGRILRGTSREAAGEFGKRKPLSDVTFDSLQYTLSFGIPNGPDTSRFAGRFSCDSIGGAFTAFRTTPPEYVSFRRIMKEGEARSE